MRNVETIEKGTIIDFYKEMELTSENQRNQYLFTELYISDDQPVDITYKLLDNSSTGV